MRWHFFLEHKCKIDFIDLLSNRMSPITRRTKLSPTFAATLANAEAKSNAVAAKDREKEKAAIEARTKMNEAAQVRNVKRKCIDTSYDTFDNVPSAPPLPPPSYTEVVNNNRTIPILTQVKQNWYGREILTNHDLGLPEVIKRCIYLLLYNLYYTLKITNGCSSKCGFRHRNRYRSFNQRGRPWRLVSTLNGQDN